MNLQLSRAAAILLWLTGYLWSVPLALAVSNAWGWQYDGDLGWWLVAAYSAPVMLLSEPLRGSISLDAMAVIYFAMLIVLTVCMIGYLAFKLRKANGG